MPGLKFFLDGDGKGFARELEKVEKSAKDAGKRVAKDLGGQLAAGFGMSGLAVGGTGAVGAVTAITAKIYESSKEILEYAKSLKLAKAETGAGIEDLQVFEYAAGKVGKTLEDVTAMMSKMAEKREEAISEGPEGEMAKHFEHMGVSFKDLLSLNPSQIFKQIQSHIAATGDATQFASDITKVFGKTAYESNALFQTSFAESEAKARQFGMVVDEEVINRINDGVKVLKEQTTSSFKGMFADMADSAISSSITAIETIKNIGTEIGKLVFPNAKKEIDDQQSEDLAPKLPFIQKGIRTLGNTGPLGILMRPLINKYADSLDPGGMTDAQSKDVSKKQAERAGRIQELNQQMAKLTDTAKLKEMTDEERLNELLRRQAKLRQELANLQKNGADVVPVKEKEVEILHSQQAIAELRKAQNAKRLHEEQELGKQLTANQEAQEGSAARLVSLEEQKARLQKFIGKDTDQTELQLAIAKVDGQIIQARKSIPQTSADSAARVGGFGFGAAPGTSIAQLARQRVIDIRGLSGRQIAPTPDSKAAEAVKVSGDQLGGKLDNLIGVIQPMATAVANNLN